MCVTVQMPTRKQEQRLIHEVNFACLLAIPQHMLAIFCSSLEGPDEDDGQDDHDPPVIPNVEGNIEEDQEPEVEDDEPIVSPTCSQMEPISAQTHSSFNQANAMPKV